jgi:hypothetical protein
LLWCCGRSSRGDGQPDSAICGPQGVHLPGLQPIDTRGNLPRGRGARRRAGSATPLAPGLLAQRDETPVWRLRRLVGSDPTTSIGARARSSLR